MFEREALEAGQLSVRETSRPGRVVVDTAAACDGVSERQVARVARFVQLGHCVRVVVCEIAGDTTDGIVHCRELGAVREASAIFWSAMCRLREFG